MKKAAYPPDSTGKNQKTVIMVIAAIFAVICAATVFFSRLPISGNDGGPVTVTDGSGRSVVIKSSNRVASTSARVAQIICGTGAFFKLAGVTVDDGNYDIHGYNIGIRNDGYPALIREGLISGALVDIGGMYRISAESILLANPDLVIMGSSFNSDATISQLEGLGIPVVIFKEENTIADIHFNIELIGKALGKVAEAEALINDINSSIEKVVDWTRSLNAGSPGLAIFPGYGYETGSYAYGSGIVMGTPLIEMLGGVNVFSYISGKYEIVSTEAIAAANPDIIIDTSGRNRSDLDSIKTNPITKSVTAAQRDAIYGAFDLCNSAIPIYTQSFVNAVALTAMFMYEDYLDFRIDRYMGDDYVDYLEKFWIQINS